MSDGQTESLSSAAHGSMLTTSPSTTSNPVGVFIHAFTAMTKNAPAKPAMIMGIPVRMWIRSGSLSQL